MGFRHLLEIGMKLSLVIALIVLLVFPADSTTLHKLRFTRSNGYVWECLTVPTSPETPALIGQCGVGCVVGSHTNTYAGHIYYVDALNNTLVKDGTSVGTIYWPGGNLDVQSHFGFCIDHAGQGWLATATLDGDTLSVLFKLSLATAEATYVDYIDLYGDNLFPVTSMTMIEFQ